MEIYKITNIINNKIYIGQTINSIHQRFDEHCSLTKSKHRSAIREAIRKYGKNNFIIEIIDNADTIEELNCKEIKWIAKLSAISPNGYNLEAGGKNKIVHHSTKLKMSIAKLGKKGHAVTRATKDKISHSRTGMKFSDKHKEALSLAKNKLKIKVKCIDSGVIYESYSAAARILKMPDCNIRRCAIGERKTCHGLRFEIVHAK